LFGRTVIPIPAHRGPPLQLVLLLSMAASMAALLSMAALAAPSLRPHDVESLVNGSQAASPDPKQKT
jgi:hypothetical protein